MRVARWILLVVVILLIIIGAAMAFDPRFLPLSQFWSGPFLALYIFAPTVLFATVALVQGIRRRIWPAAAFSVGLIATGVRHQEIADVSHGNPGYMAPMGHLAAPIISVVAYLLSFLIVWLVVKLIRVDWRSVFDDDRAQ